MARCVRLTFWLLTIFFLDAIFIVQDILDLDSLLVFGNVFSRIWCKKRMGANYFLPVSLYHVSRYLMLSNKFCYHWEWRSQHNRTTAAYKYCRRINSISAFDWLEIKPEARSQRDKTSNGICNLKWKVLRLVKEVFEKYFVQTIITTSLVVRRVHSRANILGFPPSITDGMMGNDIARLIVNPCDDSALYRVDALPFFNKIRILYKGWNPSRCNAPFFPFVHFQIHT